ncbi:MAG: hypothetical protein K8M05_39495 [Deltaproteobacteria bacterium]|nr:hypothetical protein [Kofleriaceae bacterium]
MSLVDSFPGHLLDQTITAVGEADNAFSGAVLVLADNTPIYIAGLEAWDPALRKQTLKVTGMLRRRKLAPDPTPGPTGAQRHGMQGSVFILDDASWVRAPELARPDDDDDDDEET